MAQLSQSSPIAQSPTRATDGILRQLAVQDWFLAAYFLVLSAAVFGLGSGPNHAECMQWVALDVAVFVVGVVVTRGGFLKPGTLAHGLTYRVALFASFLASYFQLRIILPDVTSKAIDA